MNIPTALILIQAIPNFPQQHNIFWSWQNRFWPLFLQSDPVYKLDHLKDHKRQENEVDWDGDEITIGKDRYAGFFEGIKGSRYVIWNEAKDNKQVCEVNSASQESRNDGHDNIIY